MFIATIAKPFATPALTVTVNPNIRIAAIIPMILVNNPSISNSPTTTSIIPNGIGNMILRYGKFAKNSGRKPGTAPKNTLLMPAQRNTKPRPSLRNTIA
jgi:hypothetical protein